MSSHAALKSPEDEFVRVVDYTRVPGGRDHSDGDFPGCEFRTKHLVPAYERARRRGVRLIVDLDGTAGYASSFLEESFGGLARLFGVEEVAATVQAVCHAQPYFEEDVAGYIRDAFKPRKK